MLIELQSLWPHKPTEGFLTSLGMPPEQAGVAQGRDICSNTACSRSSGFTASKRRLCLPLKEAKSWEAKPLRQEFLPVNAALEDKGS